MITGPLTGGCQCGAVSYRVSNLTRPSICHCRMCQRAFGHFFAPLVTVGEIAWTEGAPTYFQSSNLIKRGFCNACGTPLTYESERHVEIAIGSLEDPALVPPEVQINMVARLPFFDALGSTPPLPSPDQEKCDAWNAEVTSRQSPRGA